MRIEIGLLGGYRAFVDGRAVSPAAFEHRSLELVKLLALTRGHQRSREGVLEELWPHLDEEAAARALHKAASLARKALGDKGAIVLRQGHVLLAPDDELTIDADEFEAEAQRALAAEDDDLCSAVAGRYGGELLPGDREHEWTHEARERAASLHLRLLRQASAWEDVVALDPTDEEAHRSLMRWHAQSGNRAAALRQFRLLRDALARELSVVPEAETVELYEEIARTFAPAEADTPALVGRDVELIRGRAILRGAMEGEGTTLVVVGEAGVGKTRLCEALLAGARAAGALITRGAAHADAGHAPFGPVVEAIGRLLDAQPAIVAQLDEATHDVLAQLGAGARPGRREGPITRQVAFAALERALVLGAAAGPLVIFIDDVHDADASTLDLLSSLARAVRGRAAALVLTLRTGAPARVERMRQRVVAQAGAVLLELQPLTRDQSNALVARVRGAAGEQAPDEPRLVEAIWARARGNPFLTELLAEGRAFDRVGVPTVDVLRLVEARFARLDGGDSDELRGLVERAAVAGEELSAEVLLSLLGDDDDTRAAAGRLDAAVEAGVFVPSRSGFRFRHALLRESLLASLAAPRRAQLHARAARVLASANGRPADVASHLERSGDAAAAAPWWTQAARQEAAVGAWDTALGHVELALAHGARDPGVLALFGDLCFATGDVRAAAAYDEALAGADDEDRSDLLVRRGYALMNAGDVGGAVGCVSSATPPTDPTARARFLYLQGSLAWFMGRFDEANAASSEARALAPRITDPTTAAESVMLRSVVAHTTGTFAEQVRADFLDAGTDSTMAVAIHEGYICSAELFLYGGRPYEDIAVFMRDVIRTAEESGVRRAAAFSRCVLGSVLLLQGVLDAAHDELRMAEALSLKIGAHGSAALAAQRQAELFIARGQKELARPMLARAWDLARASPMGLRHLLQRIAGAQIKAAHDVRTALLAVDEAEQLQRGPMETCHACMITLAVPSAIACARAGDMERAAKYLEMTQNCLKVFWPSSSGWHAATAEAHAEILLASGQLDDARAHLDEAASLFGSAGQTLDLARVKARVDALTHG